ncbi:hypothetical protein XH99_10850 [Bradyrhizobium nanningense]|uniref:Uncharacterized protein n=1 Tax=Bradyrhizobium nanningense TaxID=1325118 RepID=A0A4Q0S621_9BRAD|nr:hypothetical protein [Bradyrhizobium nanningense]RXH29765.1 hypothetical protein XH84_20785 [Bradyrhizobium nanningense]RXH31433.1 hypothetical protein XH99_10850 [Bradyrhizobium nanningense]
MAGQLVPSAVVSLFRQCITADLIARDVRPCSAQPNAAPKPRGVFLFDYWYGGAELAQGVERCVKVIEPKPFRLTRISQSDQGEQAAAVTVNYTLRGQGSRQIRRSTKCTT